MTLALRKITLAWMLLLSSCASTALSPEPFIVPLEDNLPRLLKQEDTDRDLKITVRDQITPFELKDSLGKEREVRGTFSLSILLQEMSLAKEHGATAVSLSQAQIEENPVDRTSRLIRELFWEGLTRRIDEEGLAATLADSKNEGQRGRAYLYVPEGDAYARKYYEGIRKKHPELKLEIRTVPRKITPRFIEGLKGRQGLLALKVAPDPLTGEPAAEPYVVPGGRFNEMYGWDSYFITLGLLADGKLDLARAMVENQAYQIQHYGKILNANRTYYLTRSQPPFFTSMLREVYAAMPRTEDSRQWLKENLRWAIQEYETVWTVPPRLVRPEGLSRYFDEGEGPGPEVEPGGYDALVAPFARKAGLSPREYLKRYKSGAIRNPELARIFKHDRTVRETGHDTTYRFDMRSADFMSVDLNSLLYKYETDIRDLLRAEFGGEGAGKWDERAQARKKRINELLWDPEKGFFFDYDFTRDQRLEYISATAFYPLWAGITTREQAEQVMAFARKQLEMQGGLAATAESSRGKLNPPERPQRQWDFPYGWPPHQIIAWEGLVRMGLKEHAERLAYKWLYTMTKNARDFNGMVTEKYDVVKGSHEAFVEYGNVGADFSYITKEGFGWTNASYQLGLKHLSERRLDALRKLKPWAD